MTLDSKGSPSLYISLQKCLDAVFHDSVQPSFSSYDTENPNIGLAVLGVGKNRQFRSVAGHNSSYRVLGGLSTAIAVVVVQTKEGMEPIWALEYSTPGKRHAGRWKIR